MLPEIRMEIRDYDDCDGERKFVGFGNFLQPWLGLTAAFNCNKTVQNIPTSSFVDYKAR